MTRALLVRAPPLSSGLAASAEQRRPVDAETVCHLQSEVIAVSPFARCLSSLAEPVRC